MRSLAGGLAAVAVLMLTAGCGGDETTPSSPASSSPGIDPSTLAGSCSLLLGPGASFVDDAVEAGDQGGATAIDRAQHNLFTLVASGASEIQDPAGQLVDYLDDPSAYQTKNGLDPLITDAVEAIETACSGQG